MLTYQCVWSADGPPRGYEKEVTMWSIPENFHTRIKTDDMDIIQLSVDQNRTVVSKDEDFYKYFILKGQPPKLLMLTMGNIVNRDLIALFEKNIDQIEADLTDNRVVELSNEAVTVHF